MTPSCVATSACDPIRANNAVNDIMHRTMHYAVIDVNARSKDSGATPCAMSAKNERLRAARSDAGFKSAAEAADAFGWVVPTYQSHENGSRGFSFDTAEKYARAFKTTTQWLLSGKGAATISSATTHSPSPVDDQSGGILNPLDEELMIGAITSTLKSYGIEPTESAVGAITALRIYQAALRHGVRPEEMHSLDAIAETARQQQQP